MLKLFTHRFTVLAGKCLLAHQYLIASHLMEILIMYVNSKKNLSSLPFSLPASM